MYPELNASSFSFQDFLNADVIHVAEEFCQRHLHQITLALAFRPEKTTGRCRATPPDPHTTSETHAVHSPIEESS